MDLTLKLTPEQEELKKRGRELGEEFRVHAAQWEAQDMAPIKEMTQKAREKGLAGITMPKEYGGHDLTVLEYVLVAEEIMRAAQWITAGEVMFRTSGPGPSVCMLSDNEVARKKFMPKIVTGEAGAAITMTEPKYGSAITDLETTAVLEGDYYIVNGSKRFITGAVEDEFYSTFVRFGNIPGAKGIGALMIEKNTEGVKVKRGAEFVGARGMPHGELEFKNARVPKENLLIKEGQFGRLMTAFNMERMHNATCGLALAEAAFDEAKKYCLQRKQFGTEIINFQAMQHWLAEIWIEIEAHRLLTYHAAATAIDGKYPRGLEVSIAKAFENEVVPRICQKALQMHGGDGYTMAYPIQRIWRDSLVLPLGGGTIQILKNAIAQWIVPERKLERPRGGER